MNESSINCALEEVGVTADGAFSSWQKAWEALRNTSEPTVAVVNATPLPSAFAERLPKLAVIEPFDDPSVMETKVAEADLVIAPMTATRLFPGDFVHVYEEVRTSAIPIWAVVSGLSMVDDPPRFEEEQRNSLGHEWPEGSHFFSASPDVLGKEAALMRELWERKHELFFARGRQRRIWDFGRALRAQLTAAIASADTEAEALARLVEVGSAGIQGLKALCTTIGRDRVMLLVSQIEAGIRKWAEEIEKKILSSDARVGASMLQRILEEAVRDFLEKRLEKITGPHLHQLRDECSKWFEKSAGELERFFAPFANQTNKTDEVAKRARAQEDALMAQIDRWIAAQQENIHAIFSGLSGIMQDQWLIKLLGFLDSPVLTPSGKKQQAPRSPTKMAGPVPTFGRIWIIIELLTQAQKEQLRSELNAVCERLPHTAHDELLRHGDSLCEHLTESLDSRGAALLGLCSEHLRPLENRISALRQALRCLEK